MLAWAAAYLNPTPEPAKRWERTRLLRDAVRIGRLAYFSPTRVQDLYEKKPTLFSDFASSDLLLRVVDPPVFCDSPIGDSQSYVLRYGADDPDQDDPVPTPYLVLATRGTSSLQDALCDANLRLTPLTELPGVMVHAGFLEQFRALEPMFEAEIAKLSPDSRRRLLFVGHSLG